MLTVHLGHTGRSMVPARWWRVAAVGAPAASGDGDGGTHDAHWQRRPTVPCRGDSAGQGALSLAGVG